MGPAAARSQRHVDHDRDSPSANLVKDLTPGTPGSLTISGGEIVLSNANNSFTGGTTLLAGGALVPTVSSVGTAGSPTNGPFGAGSAPLNLAGGQIRATTSIAVTIGNAVIISGDTIDYTGGADKDLIFTGAVSLVGGTHTLTTNQTRSGQPTSPLAGNHRPTTAPRSASPRPAPAAP